MIIKLESDPNTTRCQWTHLVFIFTKFLLIFFSTLLCEKCTLVYKRNTCVRVPNHNAPVWVHNPDCSCVSKCSILSVYLCPNTQSWMCVFNHEYMCPGAQLWVHVRGTPSVQKAFSAFLQLVWFSYKLVRIHLQIKFILRNIQFATSEETKRTDKKEITPTVPHRFSPVWQQRYLLSLIWHKNEIDKNQTLNYG